MSRVIFKSGYVWDGKSTRLLTDGAILVEDGIIEAVGPATEILTAVHDQLYEWPQETLLPGLIDCHTHLSMDGSLDNYLAHMSDSIPELTLRATAMMRRDLEAGVTTCRCLGDREFLDIACRQAVGRGDVPGPRLLVATRGIRSPHGHGFVGYPFNGVQEIANAISENVKRGADLIKIYITGTLKGNGDLPSFLSREEIQLAIDQSHSAGLPVASHCVGGIGLDWAVEFGLDTLEHVYHITNQQLERLANSRTLMVLTPGAVLAEERVRRLPATLIEGHLRERPLMFSAMALAVQAGIPFGVGTDGTHGCLAQDLMFVAELGATNFAVMQSATIVGAEVIGLGNAIGSLEKGKFADIIAVEGNPLEDLQALKRVKAVFKKGDLMYGQNGKLGEAWYGK